MDNTQKSTHKNISPVAHDSKPNMLSIGYDFGMLLLIVFDLSLMLFDAVLSSDALRHTGKFLKNYGIDSIHTFVGYYNESVHPIATIISATITITLIAEIILRWILAIYNKTYYRWFFFPFVHWYEVVSCFPQLRALRLLRAFVIGRRLYQLNIRFLPEKWIDTGKFYQSMILEELSDRVLLTAVANIRTQLSNATDSQALVRKTIDNNRENIESMVLSMLQTELAPRLRQELIPEHGDNPIATHVGIAVAKAISRTPELNFVLRKIPIAGSYIEAEILGISNQVGYNIASSISEKLLDDEILDELFVSIAHGVAHIDTSNPALEALVADIISESLNAFENQIKNQQWQHHKEMEKMNNLQ